MIALHTSLIFQDKGLFENNNLFKIPRTTSMLKLDLGKSSHKKWVSGVPLIHTINLIIFSSLKSMQLTICHLSILDAQSSLPSHLAPATKQEIAVILFIFHWFYFLPFQKRMVHMEKSLSQSVNLSTKLELLKLVKEPVALNESR